MSAEPTFVEPTFVQPDVDAESYWTQFLGMVIRPPRAYYSIENLGATRFEYEGRKYVRDDFELDSKERKVTLQCSYWKSADSKAAAAAPCVIYCHGNAGCRLTALDLLPLLLPAGISLVAFDLGGCGLSTGDFVTLGVLEVHDLQCVVDHMQSVFHVSKLAVWGRSMGAVCALLYARLHQDQLSCLVLDSPFANLRMLMLELVQRMSPVKLPEFSVKLALGILRRGILARANFDIDDADAMHAAKHCTLPCLLIHAKYDEMIDPSHAMLIEKAYSGALKLIMVEERTQNHNSVRPVKVENDGCQFLKKHFDIEHPSLSPKL